jgi:hypothetical protein
MISQSSLNTACGRIDGNGFTALTSILQEGFGNQGMMGKAAGGIGAVAKHSAA